MTCEGLPLLDSIYGLRFVRHTAAGTLHMCCIEQVR